MAIHNNLIRQQIVNLQQLKVPQPTVEEENNLTLPATDGTNNAPPADDKLPTENIPISAFIANFGGEFNLPNITQLKTEPISSPDAETVRSEWQMKNGMSDELFDKFFEVVFQEQLGEYEVYPRAPYIFEGEDVRMGDIIQTENGFMLKDKTTVYTLYDTTNDSYIEITVHVNPEVDDSFVTKDSNGRAIDKDGSINTDLIDKSVIEGYDDNVQLHERGKGWTGSLEKMKEKATELLNDNKLKNQLKAQYKAVLASQGETYDADKFEAFYQQAINDTLNTEGLITGRGARGLSRKGHAYCNIQNLVDTFLTKFDEITKLSKDLE